tara:strand:+ start:6 stop:1073 length:1068 start_codon:yes stop_codon:yes gene_type:complete
MVPYDIQKELTYNKEKITMNVSSIKDSSDNIVKLLQSVGCNCMEEIIYNKLVLYSDKKETLLKLIDDSNVFCKKEVEESRKTVRKTINVHIWRKDYWSMLFRSPKRPIETLYLKEGIKEDIIYKIEDFFSEETRKEYLSNGIPYKNVFLLYGVPGSGKTSTINTIASHFNSGIYVIPVSKELTDYGLIDAMGFIDEQEEEHRIIVIEDIDSIFTDRKKGDDNNGISLQGLLNCFDGFSCVEGTLLFITANKPEVMDNALLRSCRVDHRYELDYADEYQTRCIFKQLTKNDNEQYFINFYKKIKKHKYTTAMLQEFLFYNRRSSNILEKIDEFLEIIKKNKEDCFKKDNQNEKIYS